MNSNEIVDILDILDVVVIPISVILIALLWSDIQSWHRKRKFKNLICRELEELKPPEKKDPEKNWNEHFNKKLIHREIFNNVAENRDFILSLDPDLVYYVSNLWNAYDNQIMNNSNTI
ncbi:MAG TPA: hypothetical protein VFP25_05230 [Nitrososphaeraceae archaeon]|nr:hypothetical protein [Nitrososphaeraceae archaeon]